MRILGRLGLRARLAIALVAVAVLAVGFATLLSNRGLHPRVTAAAEARLDRSAVHMADVAASVYAESGGWTPAVVETLEHVATLNGIRLALYRADGRSVGSGHRHLELPFPRASAPVVVLGRTVGRVVVATPGGALLTPEEQHLQASLDRLHLLAGAFSVAAALVLAFLLAQTLSRPLRRIRATAQRIERGDLSARVELGGDAEMRAVGHALNRLAGTLEREEALRKASVADLAHELRTPVSGLLSRIEAAQDGVFEDQAANLEAMHAEALRLARLLDDLSRLSEAEQPGLLLEKHAVDLAEVAERQAKEFAGRFAERGIDLSKELRPVLVEGDSDRLSQITANLLSNALRYTEPGGRVWVRVGPEAGSAVLEVGDTGIGIAPEDLTHIFKRFWRGDKSRSRATGGTGIGLTIVHELVRAHDGRIDVESAPGRGSRFRIVLPRRGPGRPLHDKSRSSSPDLQIAS